MVLAMTGGAVVAIGFVARKSWLALHRMAGITPGTLRYVEQEALSYSSPARFSNTQQDAATSANHLQYLPDTLIAQLHRIDVKAEVCFEGITAQQSTLTHPTRAISEDEFVAYKMTHERLPQMLIDYQQVMRFGEQSYLQNPEPSQVPTNDTELMAEQQATELLVEFLDQLEARLDTLREATQRQHLQSLKGMARYVRERD